MPTLLLGLFLIIGVCSFPVCGAERSEPLSLPEVVQGADAHSLSRTYCKALWQNIKRGSDYTVATAPEFKASVAELGNLILKIQAGQPVLVGGRINATDEPVVDPELLSRSESFDAAALPQMMTALKSMSVLGKHKGQSDVDNETNGKVNEIFVYVWSKVKENPATHLTSFLMGPVDASPMCIQGYSVRMMCAVHPPRLKTEGAKNDR